jgi:protein-disulfide isomerase
LTALLLAPIPNALALGNESAEIIFGDYQCTFCKRFHATTRELVVNNFVGIDKDRIRLTDRGRNIFEGLQMNSPD